MRSLLTPASHLVSRGLSTGVAFDRETPLTEAQAVQFNDRGYLALKSFCADGELAELRSLLATLFRNKIGYLEGHHFDMLGSDTDARTMRQPQIVNPSQFSPALLKTRHFKRVEAAARQLLGPHAQFSFDHSIVKPAGSRAPTPWHQDEAHHADRFFRYRQISFWMPLQDTPAESGCMRYIPYSHRGAVLPHRRLNGDARVHAMECQPETFDASQAAVEPALAGTCIAHDGRTLHAALPNSSTVDRMAYIIAFIGPPILRDRPLPRTARTADLHTANHRRRRNWLFRGGWAIAALWRLRQGIRSSPTILLLKARLLLRALFSLRGAP